MDMFPAGWLTNFKELKAELLEADPYTTFETETDTEVVAKLALQIYEHSANSEGKKITFREIVEQVCLKLVSQNKVHICIIRPQNGLHFEIASCTFV